MLALVLLLKQRLVTLASFLSDFSMKKKYWTDNSFYCGLLEDTVSVSKARAYLTIHSCYKFTICVCTLTFNSYLRWKEWNNKSVTRGIQLHNSRQSNRNDNICKEKISWISATTMQLHEGVCCLSKIQSFQEGYHISWFICLLFIDWTSNSLSLSLGTSLYLDQSLSTYYWQLKLFLNFLILSLTCTWLYIPRSPSNSFFNYYKTKNNEWSLLEPHREVIMSHSHCSHYTWYNSDDDT